MGTDFVFRRKTAFLHVIWNSCWLAKSWAMILLEIASQLPCDHLIQILLKLDLIWPRTGRFWFILCIFREHWISIEGTGLGTGHDQCMVVFLAVLWFNTGVASVHRSGASFTTPVVPVACYAARGQSLVPGFCSLFAPRWPVVAHQTRCLGIFALNRFQPRSTGAVWCGNRCSLWSCCFVCASLVFLYFAQLCFVRVVWSILLPIRMSGSCFDRVLVLDWIWDSSLNFRKKIWGSHSSSLVAVLDLFILAYN